jgi:hypothetical protein
MRTSTHMATGDLRMARGALLAPMVLLWLVYTVIYTLPIPDVLSAFLHILPGVAAVALLRVAGFSADECNLGLRWISAKGIGVLGLVTLALAGPTLTSTYVGYRPLAVFLLAPASAIAQELYFRAGLLPSMHHALPGRAGLANLLHAALFALWHVPKALIFSPINPLVGALMLASVTGLAGFGWGWQARHDRTIAWSALHHWFLLSVMSLFGL